MKKLEINQLEQTQGGKACAYLGLAAALSFAFGPAVALGTNLVVAVVASGIGCFD